MTMRSWREPRWTEVHIQAKKQADWSFKWAPMSKSMRIAQVAPLFARIPPERYGGTERVVHVLTEALVQRGHKVTLFAAGGTRTSAELHATAPAPLWEMQVSDPLAYRVLQVEELVQRADDFDIIHSHIEYLPWLAGERLRTPMVTTLHGRLDLVELEPLLKAMRGWPLVSISESQRRPVSEMDLNWVATIHHGLDLASTYTLGGGEAGHLMFLGRISPEKAPAAAIRIAITAGVPLKIAARVDPVDKTYFETQVRPLLDHPLVEWMGEVRDSDKNALLGSARALLMPLGWDEPFGLACIESLACGTPVISSRRGSLPELVVHGQDGFLCDTEEEFVVACRDVLDLDRAACRARAIERFSAQRMAGEYEQAYQSVCQARLLEV